MPPACPLPKPHDARGVASFVDDAKAWDAFEPYAACAERFVDAQDLPCLPDPAVDQRRCF
jgi:hypothetical protein